MENIHAVAKDIHKNAIICDLQLGFEPEIEVQNKWETVDTYLQNNYSYLSLGIATDTTTFNQTIRFTAEIIRHIKESDNYILFKTAADIIKAKQEKKLALGLTFQGTNPLEKNLDYLYLFYELGIRSLILAYNVQNSVGGGSADSYDRKLTPYGKHLVKQMDKLGMLIDCSHMNLISALDVIEESEHPIMFSHSAVKNLLNVKRNLTDEVIKKCAQNGGIIGLDGIDILFYDEKRNANFIESFVDHVSYIAEMVGIEHIALGLDQVYFLDTFSQFLEKNNVSYPRNYSTTVNSIKKCVTPKDILTIIECLLRRGFHEDDINKILGENYLRVIRKVIG